MSTAIILNVQNGKIIYENQAHEPQFPASMTKMMTAYMVFQALKEKQVIMDTLCSISSNAVGKPGSTLGLVAGDKVAIRVALFGMLAASANDAATVLAEAIKGTEEAAVEWMNDQARALGMTSTVFTNVSGLHDEKMVSTAYDMGLLARALLNDFSDYYYCFGIMEFSYNGVTYKNTNPFLGIKGIDGMKTGNTDAAGFNLVVSAAQEDDRRIIVVLMNAKTAEERDEKILALVDDGLQSLK